EAARICGGVRAREHYNPVPPCHPRGFPMPQDMLTVSKGGQTLKTVPLASELTIGRHQSANVQLEDPLMSRIHLKILKQSEGGTDRYFVVDNGSLNGTFHNNKKLAGHAAEELTAQSVVRCAAFELTFQIESQETGLGATIVMPAGSGGPAATPPAP